MDTAKSNVKYLEISAIITRANGTVENLGVISRKSDKWYMNMWYFVWDRIVKDILKRFNRKRG